MARFKYGWTEKRIARFYKEGRGAGHGKDYKPWLMTSDVPSLGRSHRVSLAMTGRQHHFLSDNEYYAFLNSAFDEAVVDIREQFPLDRNETLLIAAAKNIRHPQDRGVPIVMTTDLLETRIEPRGTRDRAIAIKPDEELGNERTIEKLEIERIYWSRRGVPWFIRPASSLKTTRSLNLEWIFDNTVEGDIDSVDEDSVLRSLRNALNLHESNPLREMCISLDNALELEGGKSLQIVRRLLSKKRLLGDLTKPTLSEQPCKCFSISAAL
jgi:hypothetical protein